MTDPRATERVTRVEPNGPASESRPFDHRKIEQAVRMILEAIGEDPDRAGLRDTPRRVAAAYREMFAGVGRNLEDEINVFFDIGHEEMVIVKDIPFYSVCEHHLLPFFGRAHVAYIPTKGRITGLSKLARVVDVAAKRLQVQERLTGEIADAIMNRLHCRGVLVMLEAEHLCMTMRGIKKPGSLTVTSVVRGVFKDDEKTRNEALSIIRPVTG
ncbi:MAG: GTP cyclohydrolase I FolE [Bacillota bacterium]|nr:GTP cyclohydrolase I FolE [Bacillota bacterium]REJ34681.1 MAG: GTP cyclohydrolase I FolE [Bacillota bacterium]